MDSALSTHVTGSLEDISRRNQQSLAESFVNADVVVIVDTSGSMAATDSRGRRSRYEVACEELAALQAHMPGKIAVIAFSDNTVFVPGGCPPFLGLGTDLAGALRFAKVADVPGMRFIVISDGEPDDEAAALAVASTYKSRIDVIYVGPEAYPRGRNFLQQLAAASSGKLVTADRANELAASVETLLLSA
jgi:Mg-chelatase subunit ChlD